MAEANSGNAAGEVARLKKGAMAVRVLLCRLQPAAHPQAAGTMYLKQVALTRLVTNHADAEQNPRDWVPPTLPV